MQSRKPANSHQGCSGTVVNLGIEGFLNFPIPKFSNPLINCKGEEYEKVGWIKDEGLNLPYNTKYINSITTIKQ